MMKVTDALCGDASVSVTVMVTGKRPASLGVPLTTPSLKLSPGGSVPDSDQVYAPLPPDGCRDSENARPTTGCCVPGLAMVSGA